MHFAFASACYAEEITILFTGETHAMLYPCNCPREPDGGIGRRATLIKEIRKDDPRALLVDSGNFFAAGKSDEYSQNTESDKERTKVNLKAMNLMRYDAAALGADEFNFGREFLEENFSRAPFNLLSCNALADKGVAPIPVKPYLIKEVSGVKVGIIGVTSRSARNKIAGIDFLEPKLAVEKAIAGLNKKGANLIMLMSNASEKEVLDLINEVRGIDIAVIGAPPGNNPVPSKVRSTIVLHSPWQGRRLGKLSLALKNKKIVRHDIKFLRLSDDIGDDSDILAMLPRCFSDLNCKKEGFIAKCENSGTLEARCVFTEPNRVTLLAILPKPCLVCSAEPMVNSLKGLFPGIAVSYLYYPDDEKAKKMIREAKIKFLPAYFLGKEAEQDKNFANLKKNTRPIGNYYLLDYKLTGLSYFLERKRQADKLDLFVSLYGQGSKELLSAIKDFKPQVHFLVSEDGGNFNASAGEPEVEEALRSVCVEKHYPDVFFDYIACRSQNINSSWWEDCLGKKDAGAIRKCSRSTEGKALLKENIKLNKELQIMFGPTYLLENQEIFSTQGQATKEELKKILKR